jgi:hypothetical protein
MKQQGKIFVKRRISRRRIGKRIFKSFLEENTVAVGT